MRTTLGLSAAIVSTMAPLAAHAADVEAVRVDVHAPSGCSDNESFWREVRARTARARPASPGEEARTLDVRIERQAGRVYGELLILDPRALTTHREVSGESCDAIVSVLALVAALAIDPLASTAPIRRAAAATKATPPPAAASSGPAAGAPPAGPNPPAGEASVSAESPTETRAEAPTPSERAASPPARSRVRVSAGVHLGAFAAAPQPIPDASVFADVALEAPRPFAPAFRVSFHRSTGASVAASDGTATLDFTYGRAEACPLHYLFAPDLEARPCALVDVGAVGANAIAVHPQSRVRPWAAAGASVRLAWTLARVLRVEIDGGLELPIVRETYFFAPTTYVYQAPTLAGMASLGLGVLFP